MSLHDLLYPGRKSGKIYKVSEATANAAVYAGASYGFGYLQNRYRERAKVMGVPVDLAAGAGLTVGALLADMFGIDNVLMPLARDVGHAGLGAFFHTLGAGKGAQASGIRRALIKESDVPKIRAAVPDATILGEIPPAPHGDVLTARDLRDLTR